MSIAKVNRIIALHRSFKCNHQILVIEALHWNCHLFILPIQVFFYTLQGVEKIPPNGHFYTLKIHTKFVW